MSVLVGIRNWWRGYSDADVVSLDAKLCGCATRDPGSATYLTRGEFAALRARRT